jgi:hypothetical protein
MESRHRLEDNNTSLTIPLSGFPMSCSIKNGTAILHAFSNGIGQLDVRRFALIQAVTKYSVLIRQIISAESLIESQLAV